MDSPFFKIYLLVFFFSAMMFVFFVITYARYMNNLVKKKIKRTEFLLFGKETFDHDFTFQCEYCKGTINTASPVCGYCGGTYHDNKTYKDRKKAKNLEYIRFLQKQEDEIKKATESVKHAVLLSKTNLIMKYQVFNLSLGEMSKYIVHSDLDFNCEHCGAALKGSSKDHGVCRQCGGAYSNNTELLALEAKAHLEKTNYEEYQKLKGFEYNLNMNNRRKDDIVNHNSGIILFLMMSGLFIVPAFITLWILNTFSSIFSSVFI